MLFLKLRGLRFCWFWRPQKGQFNLRTAKVDLSLDMQKPFDTRQLFFFERGACCGGVAIHKPFNAAFCQFGVFIGQLRADNAG